METHPTDLRHEQAGVGNGLTADEAAARARAQQTLWDWLGVLYARRRFVAAVTGAAAVASIVIALLMPRWYAAEARVLQPEGGGLSLLGMMGDVGGLGGLLGGGSGEYSRYLSILTSRSLLEEVAEEFDLVRVYDLEESENPLYDVTEQLQGNVEFEVNPEFLFLAVRAYDQDPERAADMANFMVAALNEEHARLSSQSARQTRTFVERRLSEAQADLDSVRSEMQAFQEEHGVVELESQAQAFMESVAALRGSVAQLEVHYQTLVRQYGPENAQVQAARDALTAARGQVRGALGGQDVLLPISMQALPALSRRYAELMQSQLTQARIIETIYPIYEQALFQERSDAVAVQVVDEAVPPVLAARPSKRLIVVVVTFSAFMLAVVFVLAHAWWRRNYRTYALRLQQAARDHTAPV